MSAAPHKPLTTDWLTPKLREGMATHFARYSRAVETLKNVLPIGAAILLALLFIMPNVTAPTVKPKSAASIDATMQGAHFESRDKEGRPYAVEAPTARQEPDAPGVTDLTTPKAKLDLGSGSFIDAEAGKAKYDDKTGKLQLEDNLTLKRDDGTTFKTDAAIVDVNTQNAEGHAPVVLQGSFGEVRGEGFKAIDGGKTIIFTGQTKATIKLGSPPPATSPKAPQNKAP